MPRVQHVMPAYDDREHQFSPWCWCGPDEVRVGKSRLYMHHAADMREVFEKATGEAFKGRIWTRVEVKE
jgi:isocitrate dehydrogenase kinase/phosphatase